MEEQQQQQQQQQSNVITTAAFDNLILNTAINIGQHYVQSVPLKVLVRITALKAVSIGRWHPFDWEIDDPLDGYPEYMQAIHRDPEPFLGDDDKPFPTYTQTMLQISWPMVQNIWFDYLRQNQFGDVLHVLVREYINVDRGFRDQLDENDNIAIAICMLHYHNRSRESLNLPSTVMECVEFWYDQWVSMQEATLRDTEIQRNPEFVDAEEKNKAATGRKTLAMGRALILYDKLYGRDEGFPWSEEGDVQE